MKIVVTGATGFIGRHLTRKLRSNGHLVVSAARSRSIDADHSIIVDVTDPSVIDWLGSADVFVHLAGSSSATLAGSDPLATQRVNALGTLHVLEAAQRSKARFVLASSQRVYRPASGRLPESQHPDPVETYGFSKLVAETWTRMYAQSLGLPIIILRPFTVYGPGQWVSAGHSGVAAIFLQAALDGTPIWVDGNQHRDLVFVDDVVDAFVRAIERTDLIGETFNVGRGVPVNLLSLAKLAIEVTGSSSTIEIDDRGGEGVNVVADPARAASALNFRAQVGLEAGLAAHAEWLMMRKR